MAYKHPSGSSRQQLGIAADATRTEKVRTNVVDGAVMDLSRVVNPTPDVRRRKARADTVTDGWKSNDTRVVV